MNIVFRNVKRPSEELVFRDVKHPSLSCVLRHWMHHYNLPGCNEEYVCLRCMTRWKQKGANP